MTMTGRAAALALAGTTVALTMAAEVQARELRFALGLPEIYATYEPMVKYAATLTAEAGLDAKVFALSLLSLGETPAGLRDGLADIGFVVFPYFPAEFSELNLFANLSMLSTTGTQVPVPGAAMAGASMEYTLLHCPECLAQMTAQNHVYLSGTSTGPYALLCNVAVTTVADVAGKRFRSGAANFGRWAEHFGGTTVAVTGNEIYDALGQGTVDCTMNSVGDMLGNRYIDVTKFVTQGVPGGVFAGLGANSFNLDVWRGLTDDQRAVAIRASAALAAESVLEYHKDDSDALAAAREKGIPIIAADPALMAASAAFVDEDLKVIEKQFTDSYGVQNAAAKIALARTLIEKWKGLTAPVGTDAAKLADLYWVEVLSKIDPKTHGMN